MNDNGHLSRRRFMGAAAGLSIAGYLGETGRAEDLPRLHPPPRSTPAAKTLAVVTTVYHYLSHAYHICGRFLNGYLQGGRMHYSDFGIGGMYVAQRPRGDLSPELAAKHGFRLYPDIAGALTLGGDRLAVDGVLLIAEHGDYPSNAKMQMLYPRYEFFQKIVEVFRKSGRVVPVFCDKHLSYDRHKAAEMVKAARELNIPLYAGSSLPVTWRRPELELPPGCRIQEAVVASRGHIEVYGIHALESLQCMVERRRPKQQGVKAVTCLEGDAVWKAADEGKWSWDLLEHALGRSPSLNVGDVRENCRHYMPTTVRSNYPRVPVVFLIEYRDGLKAAVFILNGHHDDTVFAARVAGEKKPVSTLFYLPPPPGAAFLQALTVKIEGFLAAGNAPYPVERTQLTGGILDWALESRVQGYKRLETPDLDMTYEPPADSGFQRGDYTNPV